MVWCGSAAARRIIEVVGPPQRHQAAGGQGRDATAPPARGPQWRGRESCHRAEVIVYSSTMIGNCPELSGSDRILEPIKYTAAQAITGMNGGRQDRRSGNPLVAGSGPARPTSEVYDVGLMLDGSVSADL
jgi:hypothetical protein